MVSEILILVGVVIGGIFSFAGTYFSTRLQQKKQSEREYQKLAFDMATLEYNRLYEYATVSKKSVTIAPLESFITYYLKYIEYTQKGSITLEGIEILRNYQKELNSIYNKE